MKNPTPNKPNSFKLWPDAKRVRAMELILLLLLIGAAGYDKYEFKSIKSNDPAPVVVTTPAKPAAASTQAEAPVVAPVVAAIATPVVAAVVPPIVTTTTVTGGQGGAEAPVVVDPVQLPSGITGVAETQVYNPSTERSELQPLAGGTFDVIQGSTVVASVTSNADGTFQLDLDAGDYTIVPTSALPHFFPYLTQNVTVVSEQYTNVTVIYTPDFSKFFPPILPIIPQT
jgi:hypothetical protein